MRNVGAPQSEGNLYHNGRGSNYCQSGADPHTPFSAPWRGTDREADKTQLFKYVRYEANGVPLAKVVSDIFGEGSIRSANADYQLARRFYDRYDLFKTERRSWILWVEPTLDVFNLSQQYANRKTSGGRQGGLSNGESSGNTGVSSRAARRTGGTDSVEDAVELVEPTYPKGRAKSILSKRTILDDSHGGLDYREDLLAELATERNIQADKYQVLERVRATGNPYLLIPYLTRFNDRARARNTRDRFRTALRQAAESYHDAVILSLTVDPKRHNSLTAALESLSENKNRLLSWLATDYQLGHRPENLTVLEFTESGLPHFHVVLFGLSWLMPQGALAGKWDDLGAGRVLDIRGARKRGDRWLMHNDDGGTVTVQQYLGKAIQGLMDLADMGESDLQEAVEDGEVSGLWKHALYWGTGRQYCSCSPALKEPTEDGRPHVTVWRFRGVAEYRDIPAHVRQNAIVVHRGPPPPI